MTKWLAMLTACLALGLVVGACGDDDEDENGGGGATTEEPAPAGGGADEQEAPAGETVEVSMSDLRFHPESVTVERGTTVRWVNDESVGHDVTKESGPGSGFSSGDPGGLQEGDTYEQTFNTRGEIEYVCTVHPPDMRGTITVR